MKGGLLAGDIGGTKTTLAVFAPEGGAMEPLAELTLPSARYPSLESLVREFLDKVGLPIDHASLGVAGPVIRGRATITNLPWVIDEGELREALGLSSVRLLNDLEAIAYWVPRLTPSDLYTLNQGEANPGGTMAVIAAGTGLGEAFVTWDGSRYLAHASEGGHADFSPTNPTEVDLLIYLRERFDHVSFERVCSGRGLANIYAYHHRGIGPSDKEFSDGEEIARAEDPTPLIVAQALEKEVKCGLCVSTLDTFVSILGAEVGNLALKVLATSGVYIGGGIPPRILAALKDGRFMRAFLRKGRMAPLLARIPVHIMLSPRVALLGAARYGTDIVRKEGGEP